MTNISDFKQRFASKAAATPQGAVLDSAKMASHYYWLASIYKLPVIGDMLQLTKLEYTGPSAGWAALEATIQDKPEGSLIVFNECQVPNELMGVVVKEAFKTDACFVSATGQISVARFQQLSGPALLRGDSYVYITPSFLMELSTQLKKATVISTPF